jgi:hypothetical protein
MARDIETLADFLQATNEEISLSLSDVPARLHACEFWQAMVSLPGCLPHAFMVSRSRADCIAFLRDAGAPRGTLPKRGEGTGYGKRYAYEIMRNNVRGMF